MRHEYIEGFLKTFSVGFEYEIYSLLYVFSSLT